MKLEEIEALITHTPDFPIPNILFHDIFPILQNSKAFRGLLQHILKHIKDSKLKVDCIVALDARGFLFGPYLALELEVPFVPIRKKGKLPPPTLVQTYTKEYGVDSFEMSSNALKAGLQCLIVDDLLATGGSAKAACELVKQAKAEVSECVFLVELEELKGKGFVGATCWSVWKYPY